MKKKMTIAAFLLAVTLPAAAQEWSIGVGTGPFVFGDFVERRLRPTTGENPSEPIAMVLSAATRPGLAVDIERRLTHRFALRLEGTFTRAPLSVEQEGGTGGGVEIDAGHLDVSTFSLPLIWRINRGGSFRFHLLGGPALAIYRASGRSNATGAPPTFEGTQAELGLSLGGGVAWWLSDRFAIEGNITDTVTASPFEEAENPDIPGVQVLRPHNVHTTVSARWRF